jgi:tetratricopeptide (TPR) repeat protein
MVVSTILVAVTLATYAPALKNGFVWDDEALILRDPLIRSWRLIGEGFQHFLFTDAAASDFFRPLQRLSYTLDYAGFFVSPLGYHLVNILWHAAAAIALFLFADELLASFGIESRRRLQIASLASFVWVVHPVQSAAVIYVSGRADPMAATFGFFALYLSLQMLRTLGNRRWFYGIYAGFCFLASALSKESGLVFLLVWLVIAVVHRPRARLSVPVGMIAAISIAYFGLRFPAEHFSPPAAPAMPLRVRPILVSRAAAEYAGLIVLPLHLHMDRDVATHPFGFVAASLEAAARRELQTLLGVIVIAAAACLLYRARRSRAIFCPLFLALVTYLPISGIIPLNATVAEHWLYLPSAFLFVGGAVALYSLGSKTVSVCLAIWLLFLPVRTFVRCFDWKDQRTFLTRTIADGGDSARMLINLGALEAATGNLDAARATLERALEKEPGNPLARLDLATVKMKQHEFTSARELLNAIDHPPELEARAAEAIAVLENRESGTVNLRQLHLAARIGPPNWLIEERYIKALADLGFSDRAILELKSCLALAPYRAESWFMMSKLLRQTGLSKEAGEAFAQARAIDVHLLERIAAR